MVSASAEFRPGIPRSELPQVWSYSGTAPVDTTSESIERLGVGLPLSRLHVTGLKDYPALAIWIHLGVS